MEGNSKIEVIGESENVEDHASWLFSVKVKNRRALQQKLLENGIESNQVHYRNDRYSIFGKRRTDLPNMDAVEEDYLVLPLHTRMDIEHVDRICEVLNSSW